MKFSLRRAALAYPGVILSFLIGSVTGLGLYVFWYARGASYLSDDPRTCVNCHNVYESWEKSSHHAFATCNSCHTPHDFLGKWLTKAENGFNHSRAFTLQDFHEPIQISARNARLLEANCVDCHKQLVGDILAHRQVDGQPVQERCTTCHNTVGHAAHR